MVRVLLSATAVSGKVPKKPDVPMIMRLEKVLTAPRLHHF